ncbi:hypothetical protein AA0242T_1513 [Acetobacter aceti NRIC 0242]|uniref:Uncharacterized protein n=1 Tax=Acetobacter aceti NBRC 14818 TaxID=887700 RepID=A0AB33I9V0_ACEAC|nr:hypothetical protein [Acetobacter aceti]TCS32483.1 hypothetical protein EDC15_11241 [Acetobacter aceti NBRC 14818]BCK75007.1 hypothetical protein EMQ_0613 [Acetobacter aceti NBRC 14818]GAN56963.1 hypothetical protein Abac_012_037 [Acetobacter aceti NBRC 14818]GBO80811.1 hypothetical protein AA0242T_1513 [Acetobacter aceti NRIC 0242]
MSENKPDNNRPVDPVSRLRSALDRIAFALEHRREEAQPSVPETVVEGPQPDVQKAIATLDALMVDVKTILGDLAPASPREKPVETSTDSSLHEPSHGDSGMVPDVQNIHDGWLNTSDHDVSQYGEGH